jgi:tetratricopeptide (TPR) repeat protein
LSLALSGCVHPPARGSSARAAPRAGPDTEPETDAVLDRRAQSHAHFANGVVLEVQGRTSRAVAEFQQAAELDPANEELAWEVARRCVAARRADAAIKVLQASAKQTGASGLTWARLAALQLQGSETEAALESAREAVRRDPGILQGYQTLFLTHLQAARWGEARATLLAAEPHGGDDPEFYIQLAELHLLLLTNDPARRDELQAVMVRLLDRASQLPIDDDLLRLRLADTFAAAGEEERATRLYEQLLETLPDVPGVRDNVRAKLTDAYLRGKDTTAAARELRKLLDADPTNMRAAYLLGGMAFEARDFEAARDYYRRVIILRPQFEQAYYDLAGVLLNLNRPFEADEVIQTARGKFPASFAMDFISALVDMQREQFVQALTHFTRAEITAQALDPSRLNPFFYFQFGAAAERSGDYALAERHLQKCLELEPEYTAAQNYLGYMWAERGENLPEAEALIRKAVATEPENAAYLDSLAWVLFKQGRAADALEVMKRALVHLEGSDATLYEHLGDIHQALGNRDDALAAWRKSLDVQRTDSVVQRLKDAGWTPPEPAEPAAEP